MLSGFRNSPLISIHIIIKVSLVLYFSKYIHLRQYYEFPFILRDLRHMYWHVLCQLRPKSIATAMIINLAYLLKLCPSLLLNIYLCILQSDFKLIIVIVPAITDYNIMWPILVVKKVDNFYKLNE